MGGISCVTIVRVVLAPNVHYDVTGNLNFGNSINLPSLDQAYHSKLILFSSGDTAVRLCALFLSLIHI